MSIQHLDLSGDLDMVFTIQQGAWSPRLDVYAAAFEAAMSSGSLPPSNQAVYAALRARGFKESKINGVVGFRDIIAGPSARVLRPRRVDDDGRVHGARNVNPSPWFVPATQPE